MSAAITIFEGVSEGTAPRPYVDVHRIFAHRELIELAKRALAEQGPLDTRQIVQYVMAAKGLETGDKVLAKAIAYKIIHSLRQQERRGKLANAGKRGNVRLWTLPTTERSGMFL